MHRFNHLFMFLFDHWNHHVLTAKHFNPSHPKTCRRAATRRCSSPFRAKSMFGTVLSRNCSTQNIKFVFFLSSVHSSLRTQRLLPRRAAYESIGPSFNRQPRARRTASARGGPGRAEALGGVPRRARGGQEHSRKRGWGAGQEARRKRQPHRADRGEASRSGNRQKEVSGK